MRTRHFLAAFLLTYLISACAHAGGETAMEFAERLQNIIAHNKIEELRSIPCMQLNDTPKPSICVDDFMQFLFGAESGIHKLLSAHNTKRRIFGPHHPYADLPLVMGPSLDQDSYTIVYYDPSVVEFNLNLIKKDSCLKRIDKTFGGQVMCRLWYILTVRHGGLNMRHSISVCICPGLMIMVKCQSSVLITAADRY